MGTLKFNPPPNWPTPAPDWLPPEGWTPDPSWPPLPSGWSLLIEVTESPAEDFEETKGYKPGDRVGSAKNPNAFHGDIKPLIFLVLLVACCVWSNF